MHLNSAKTFRLLLLGAVFSISLYFTCLFLSKCFAIFPLKGSAPAKITEWAIEEKEDRFTIGVKYSFYTQENSWSSVYHFQERFWSQAAALAVVKTKAKEPWTAHFRPENPAISSLEKSFPVNILIRMVICYIITIYFYFLNKKVDLLA